MKNSLFSLHGKVAVVTGGNQGIGKVVAMYLAEAGAGIVLLDINNANQVAADIAGLHGVKARSYMCDVTKPVQVEKCLAQAAAEFGTLDLLFNNAGICIHKPALDNSEQEWRRVIDVNLNGMFFVAQAFAKYLVQQEKKGNIVNTASMSGHIVNIPRGHASYNASKAGIIHLTKSLAVEFALKGIRVNCISPGYMKTELTESVCQQWQDAWLSMIPFERFGEPDELAGAVIYLLSEASSYTSGAEIVIDGGYSLI